jgi:hypothetical protein
MSCTPDRVIQNCFELLRWVSLGVGPNVVCCETRTSLELGKADLGDACSKRRSDSS